MALGPTVGAIPIASEPLSMAGSSVVMVTCNTDIYNLTNRINRIIFEMQHSQSAGITNTIPADQARIGKYLDDLRKQVVGTMERGIPDYSKTHPEQIRLKDVPEKEIENDDNKGVIDTLYIMRDELVGSNSSRMGGGLLPFDYQRAIDALDRLDHMFKLFIPAIAPVDNPESVPSVPLTGHGLQGN